MITRASIGRHALATFALFSVLFLSLALGTSSAAAGVLVQPVPGGKNITVRVDGVRSEAIQTRDGKSFQRLSIIGARGHEGVLYRVGYPEIPVIRFYVDGPARVTVGSSRSDTSLSSTLPVIPNQPSFSKGADAPPAFSQNAQIYQADTTYPSSAYELTRVGSIGGTDRYLVSLYPVSYNPRRGEFLRRDLFSIQTQFSAKRAIHGADAIAFVIPSEFKDSDAIESYQRLKESLGYHVERVIVGTSSLPADPVKIRAKLVALYKRGDITLKHALLFGDAEDLPGFPSSIIMGTTDHYYSTLDTDSYASDINTPDISIGRISATSEEQLEGILNKYTAYQEGNFSSEEWLTHPSFLATNDQWQVAEGTHNYVIDTYMKDRDYTGNFPNNPQDGGDKIYAITHKGETKNVMAALEEGRFFLDYSGHGAKTYWDAPRMMADNVRSIEHADARPFVISNACITGDFRVAEAFAETWQRHPKGAIVFWGSMDSTYWGEDDILERRMADGIWRDRIKSFGEITEFAMGEFWKNYGGEGRSKYYRETYHVFGDPSILFRDAPTSVITVDGPDALPAGSSEVRFSLRGDSNKPVANARVALIQRDNGKTLFARSDAQGVVTLEFTDDHQAPAVYDRVIYADNAAISRSDFRLVSSGKPYLAMSQFQANGDSKGVVHPGETVNITFKVKNVGTSGTSGASVNLSKVEGPASILLDASSVPALASGASATFGNDVFQIKVSPTASLDESITLTFDWQTNDGASGESTWNLTVSRGTLTTLGTDFGLNIPANTGGIAVGESGDLYVTLENGGTESMRNIELKPRKGVCVADVDGEVRISSIAPGDSTRIERPLSVEFSTDCVNGDTGKFTLEGTYESASMDVPVTVEVSFRGGVVTDIEIDSGTLSLPIPDGPSTDLIHEIPITATGDLVDLALTLDIRHPYTGDLIVNLDHPDGSHVNIINRSGGSTDDIHATYGMDGLEIKGLAALLNKPATGIWKLQIKDVAESDSGTLSHVGLKLRGYLAVPEERVPLL